MTKLVDPYWKGVKRKFKKPEQVRAFTQEFDLSCFKCKRKMVTPWSAGHNEHGRAWMICEECVKKR